MPDDLLIHHVELSYLKDEPHYVISSQEGVLTDDPTIPAMHGHLVPATVFESRAAQYGIDPDSPGGWDELLLLVLGPQGEDGVSVAEELDDPEHLYNAPTVEHARKAKLRKIRKAMGTRKLRGVPGVSENRLLIDEATQIEHSDAEDPLEFIKRTAPMSPEHIAVKAEHTRRLRITAKARRLGLDPNRGYSEAELEQHAKRQAMRTTPTRESADQLAIRLLGAPLGDAQADRVPPRLGTPSKYL